MNLQFSRNFQNELKREHLRIPRSELADGAREREVWGPHWKCCLCYLTYERLTMDGWMDGWTNNRPIPPVPDYCWNSNFKSSVVVTCKVIFSCGLEIYFENKTRVKQTVGRQSCSEKFWRKSKQYWWPLDALSCCSRFPNVLISFMFWIWRCSCMLGPMKERWHLCNLPLANISCSHSNPPCLLGYIPFFSGPI